MKNYQVIQHQLQYLNDLLSLLESIGVCCFMLVGFGIYCFRALKYIKDIYRTLLLLDGEILISIVLDHLEYGGLKNGKEIVAEFSNKERNKVLLSINRIELMGYIKEVTNASNEVVGYIPTKKGRWWCEKNFHNQPTHSTLSGNDATG